MDHKTLSTSPVGLPVSVDGLSATGPNRRRLLDLGLTPGASVVCLYAAPSGNPRAYYIRGAVIALRNQDASCVTLQ